jgi:dTDP-4-dehydrorhamnose 3,5-epimerase
VPGAERGIRWDDPGFGIEWPVAEAIVSEKDSSWPDFELEVRA